MTKLHEAHIKYNSSPKGHPESRSIQQVTTRVYGQSESAALQKLKEQFPNRQDFVILELQWKS
jgi:hypothetical protein